MMNEYTIIEFIGEGSYGEIYKAQNDKTKEFVAVKRTDMLDYGRGIPQNTKNEISSLKQLNHPNIVKLLDVDMDDKSIFCIFELLDMDLKEYLESLMPNFFLKPKKIKSFLCQILMGIMYCHENNVLHRDLKPENLLIDNRGVIKIADFGWSKLCTSEGYCFTPKLVTRWYRPPEILLGATKYTNAVDLWSIGCIFAEMTTKKPLFKGDCQIDQLLKIFDVLGTPMEDSWPGVMELQMYAFTFPHWIKNILARKVPTLDECGLDLLQSMLVYNPEKRISARDALRHAYFKDMN